MIKKLPATLILLAVYLTGCASVPMATEDEDKTRKEFSPPPMGKSGLYIYRNTNLGGALKKTIIINSEVIGETAPMTYFYKVISPGSHKLSTESEFSANALALDAIAGKNYFVHQSIRVGVFMGGANLKLVSEETGKKGVLECKLAK